MRAEQGRANGIDCCLCCRGGGVAGALTLAQETRTLAGGLFAAHKET